MSKSIVITGSGGILGTALLREFSKKTDFQVYAVTSQVEKVTKEYEASDNIQVFSSIMEIPENTEKIAINCAFPRVNKGKELATAFEYTETLIDQLDQKSCAFFINISSQSVYVQSGEEIQTETSTVAPGNLYGMTKYAIERIVEIKSQQYNMDYTNIRLGSLASSIFDQRMINQFFQKIMSNELITVDSGTPRVSYLHIEDAANALVQLSYAIYTGHMVKATYNLANNDWMYIEELVKECLSYGEKLNLGRSEVIFTDETSDYNNVIQSDFFYNDINWNPNYSMKKLIKDIFDKKIEGLEI